MPNTRVEMGNMTDAPAEEYLTYREAIREALAEEMRRDPKVILLGEDIGPAGGVFKITEGLHAEFGDDRVRDTPIAEEGFVGAALGLALTGFRPVIEIMFADFLGVCFDQIANNIAKYSYLSGGRARVPLVIRAVGGGGLRFGPQHSQTAESWFLPFPGLKIACPSEPDEAYRMLKAAIRDDNPVLVIEHKALLGVKGSVRRLQDDVPALGGPVIRRRGQHVTIVASLAMVRRALEAAEQLAQDGIEAEVIDIRVLRPLDTGPIAESVRRTHALVTVEEQSVLGGWGSHVIAQVVEDAFEYLDVPPIRLGVGEHPVPHSPVLEDAVIPDAERIATSVRKLLRGTG